MMMVAMGFAGFGSLEVILQTGISRLRVRKIAGFQGADQALIVRIGLAVIAKRLIG